MIKNYRVLCEKLKINYKKDITLTLIISLVLFLGGIIVIFISQSIVGLFVSFIGMSYFLSHYFSLKSSYSQLIDAKQIAFNGFYRYVVTSLENGEILYSALKSTIEYCDEVLVEDVETLISEIETDTTLQPFLNFAEIFKSEQIRQLVILLYHAQEASNVSAIIERINEVLLLMQDDSIDVYINKEAKKIEKFSILPIALTAIVMLIVTMYIFSMIGSGIYV